jgi:TonB family protein
VLDCVVRPNGRCSDIRVARSLDPVFGLDEEAKRAAALWRFKPGTRRGDAVPVVVRLELEFTIR